MSNGGTMRWDPYMLANHGTFDEFWSQHIARRSRKLLMVLGRGFDPRALAALKQLQSLGVRPDVWLIAFDNGLPDSGQREKLTLANQEGLLTLVGTEALTSLEVRIGGAATKSTSRSTSSAIAQAGPLLAYDDVIVDISAMPRMVALTSVAKLLYEFDKQALKGERNINLHVVTAESVATDLRSHGSLMDETTSVLGFSGQLNGVASEHVPRVWFPILGESQSERLGLIRSRLDPDEICPVIPFPSRDPRRGDDIITEHRDTLFEDFQVEPSNILRASEFNPFEAYRQLYTAMDRYRRTLKELGGCKAFVSPLSSKLLSIGALLACYDHRHGQIDGPRLMVGIPYVETAVYGDPKDSEDMQYELYSMWIRGEWET